MNPFIKQLLITSSIYATLAGLIYLLNWTSAADSNGPSGGLPLVLLGIPIVSSAMLGKSILRMTAKHYEYIIPFFASASVLFFLAYQLKSGSLF